jgi:hypothetical protein
MSLRSHLRPRAQLNRRAHPVLVGALVVTLAYGSVALWKRANRPGGRWVGQTHCSWIGQPRVTILPGLQRVESLATVSHESVHVTECRRLGPAAYRWNTLFAKSNLALEAPAYCAAARVRARNGWALNTIRESLVVDMLAAMGDEVDSASIARSLRSHCREFAPL